MLDTSWYCMILPNTSWCSLILPNTSWEYLKLRGIAQYCLLLPDTDWHCRYCLILPDTDWFYLILSETARYYLKGSVKKNSVKDYLYLHIKDMLNMVNAMSETIYIKVTIRECLCTARLPRLDWSMGVFSVSIIGTTPFSNDWYFSFLKSLPPSLLFRSPVSFISCVSLPSLRTSSLFCLVHAVCIVPFG